VKNLKVEKARIEDIPKMHQFVNYFADKGDMLPRPLSELYENIRDFFVAREGGEVVACAALHVYWSDLAEVRTVAVVENRQRRGIGSRLVSACLEEAKRLGIPTVFTLANKPAFFERLGFRRIDVMELPRKVWGECYRCPKFPNCDEVALIYRLEPLGASP